MILSVSVSALILPFTLYYLSGDELGLWYVFTSIGSLISLLDFGFTPTISRNIAYAWSGANKLEATDTAGIKVESYVDAELFATVIKSSRLIFVIISIIALIILLCPGTFYIWSIASHSDCAFWLESWAIFAASVFLNLLFTYYNSYLRGIGAVAESSKATAISKLFQLACTIGLLVMGLGLLGTSIGYFLSIFVLRVLSRKYFHHNSAVRQTLDRHNDRIPLDSVVSTMRTMWPNTWREGLVSLSTFLSTQVNTLICSSVLGLTSTGFYGFALQIAYVIMTVALIWYTTIQPKLQECAVKKQIEVFKDLFAQAAVVYIAISVGLVFLSAILCPLLIAWLRPSMDFIVPMYLVVCLYMFIYKGNNLCVSAISNFNVLPYTKAYILTGLISAIGTYLLAAFTDVGIWSLVIAPLIVFSCYNGWKWPLVILRNLHVKPIPFLIAGVKGLYAIARKHIMERN